MLWWESVIALIREFGPWVGGILGVVFTLAGVIKYQNTKLEKSHENTIKAITDGYTREIVAIQANCDRAWLQAATWQQQAERLAERYVEATKLAADMSNEVLDRRRRSSSR